MESTNKDNPTREEAERFAKLLKNLDVEKQRALLLMIHGAAVQIFIIEHAKQIFSFSGHCITPFHGDYSTKEIQKQVIVQQRRKGQCQNPP